MAVVNRERCDNQAKPEMQAYPKCDVPVAERRGAFTAMAGMLVLSLIAAIPSAYGSEHSGASHAAASARVSSTVSSEKDTKNTNAIGLNSPMSESEQAHEIVWEPIGKYSPKEIGLVSDTIGELFAHMKKMEAIESGVAPLVQGGDKAADKGMKLRAAKKYSVDAQEESKQIGHFKLPAIKNRQAAEMLVKAKAALENASAIQKERAAKVVNMISGKGDSKALSGEIQELGSRRISAAFQFVNAYMAYESYGYTSDQIDLTTGRLKKDAKPDRL